MNQVVFDQLDLFEADGYTRVQGVALSDVSTQLFWNNVVQPWPLVDGASVPDAVVKAGQVYWQRIAGEPGFYGVRFRPNAGGHWRLVVTYASGSQIVALGFDVIAEPERHGLKATFIRTQ